GGTPEQWVGNADAAPGLSVAWKRGFGQGAKRGRYVTAPPVVADGRGYVMDAGAEVSARDARTGAEIWHTNLRPSGRRDKEACGGGVACADGKLYVASGYRLVAQLDAATGRVGWTTRTDQPIHAAPT